MFMKTPCFPHQPHNAMPVYGAAEFLFGNRKTYPHGRKLGATLYNIIDKLSRKNRKRFPGMEKRINMLLALQPLVCSESITNGKMILKVI